MMHSKRNLLSTVALAAGLFSATAVAQDAASVKVHGHANNPIGQVLKGDSVRFTKDLNTDPKDRKYLYTFTTDDNGDWKGEVAPGTYFVQLSEGAKSLDYIESITFKANEDRTVNFDLSRPDYINKMTKEEQAQVEEYKKKNAAIMSSNANVANLNALLKSTRADLASASPNYDSDITQLKAAVDANPNESLLYFNYGNALAAKADKMSADDRAAHKPPMSDTDVVKEYTDAAEAEKKGIELNAASKKPTPADQAIAWNSIGTAYGKIGKNQDAQDAFEQAAKLNPAGAGLYYANEAAILFNAGSTEAAGAAAEKAIAADPSAPNPYYIKGQALISKSTVDKAGKIQPPPGCIEAYQKYLELAPDGKMAPEVKNILTSMGQTINTKYKAPGKK